MKKSIFAVALCAAGLVAMLPLAGCGANLDRDVDVAGMTVSVPSDWAQQAADDNTDTQGSVTYEKFVEDADDEAYTAIVISYQQSSDALAANADQALALKQQGLEEDFGVTNWLVDDEDTKIIDGAEVTTYKYSFEKEIDHVVKEYEYQTAYVFAGDMTYEISTYGDGVAIGDVVNSIEL